VNPSGAVLSKHQELNKYRQAFQDEAREILVDLESTLLELNDDHRNNELVGRAFRALHTIKGSVCSARPVKHSGGICGLQSSRCSSS